MGQPTNIAIFDRSMNKLAYLENAHSISYELPLNSLWTATFSLPASDEKAKYCQAFNFVELYDDDEYIGLFRILPSRLFRSSDGAIITYQCEHVLATLLDDVLFQYHTVGNLGVYTSDVIEYVLSKQIVTRWQLGDCDFTRQFEYNWENDNLLGALFSIPKPFVNEYMWTWDTTSFPWTINLIEPSNEVEAYIRYGVNMQGIEKDEDPTSLCTRIYPLGYGEGVNQLNIAEINNGSLYIDSDTQDKYGIISRVWTDRRYENVESLKARAEAMLEKLKVPYTSYKVNAAELFKITNDPLDKFKLGTNVRVDDDEIGIQFTSRVVKYSKRDLLGAPGVVSLEIANKTQEVSSTLADLESRQRINETHAQGATNINSHDYSDNCSTSKPAKIKFWIPSEVVRINKVLLSYESEPFRAYSQAVAGGGAFSDSITSSAGGSSLVTSGDSGIDVIYGYGETELADGHTHTFRQVQGHKHNVNIPNHTHTVSIEIPNHTHDIQYGIYEGTTASTITLKVDGNTVPVTTASASEVDLIEYLDLDGGGKVTRGVFHEIEITPNRLSRIAATVVIQFFVQSRGGGEY